MRCLIQLDRPVDAYDNLELALRYGSAPLEEAVYAEALGYKKLLAGQVAQIEVTCAQPGVAISLDGQELATCPATTVRRVAPGHHRLQGTRDGFQPRTVDVEAAAGALQRTTITLAPIAAAAPLAGEARLGRRWATWKSWVVFATGLAATAAGTAFEVRAFATMHDYDALVASRCPNGCTPGDPISPPPSTRLRDRAERDNAIGLATGAAGLAAVATGAVMLYVNRERLVRDRPAVTLSPTGDGLAVLLGGRF
ncbi:MAG: hypothetical protein KF773_04125 [Deltaproteobacteria bacterium]|nr:hypothetical protein [Deltaproteobacteria bacterium]